MKLKETIFVFVVAICVSQVFTWPVYDTDEGIEEDESEQFDGDFDTEVSFR
jgi:hypothetical protein